MDGIINTCVKRLKILKWLYNNNNSVFGASLKVQKFMFFYEVFSKVKGSEYSFDYLKGYHKGPVFSEVYGDYTYRFSELVSSIGNILLDNSVDNDTAIKANFLVSIMTEKELSNLTHKFNIWYKKKPLIESDYKQVSLDEKDFNCEDNEFAKELLNLYSVEEINNSIIIKVKQNYFIFEKTNYKPLNEDQERALEELASKQKLKNPVYVDIAKDGVLEIE